MNPLRDPAPEPTAPDYTGMRVSFVNITLPRADDAPGAVSQDTASPTLAAYVWAKIEDGHGHGLILSDLRLMRRPGGAGYFVVMPMESKKTKCPKCAGRNVPRANYCNWCQEPLKPARETSYHDFARCNNEKTYVLLHDAIVAEFHKQAGQAFAARNRGPAPTEPAGRPLRLEATPAPGRVPGSGRAL